MKINLKIIKELKPCTNRLRNFIEHYPDFEGTHKDFLALEKISHSDKLWVLLRLMSRFEVEVFAIDCAASAASAASATAYAASYAASYAAAYATACAAYYATRAAYYATPHAAACAVYAYYATGAAYDEEERQLAAINYLINSSEEQNENHY